MKNKIIYTIISLILIMTSLMVCAADFSDISGHWAENTINKWSERNIISGYNGKFDPDGELTRAQMATVLSNMLGLTLKSENIYADVNESDWFFDAILRCTHAGIMSGDGTNANPDMPITREAAMVMIARALNIPSDYTVNKQISDLPDISDWAKEKVYSMVNMGYVNGVGNNMIKPKDNISRAAIMTILDNAIAMYIDSPGEYEISDDFSGIVVIKGNDVTLKSNHNNFTAIISEEYSYKLNVKNIENSNVISSGGNTSVISGSGGNVKPRKTYTVRFYDEVGNVISKQEIIQGNNALSPIEPQKSGYIFDGWNSDFSSINENREIFAKWFNTSDSENCFAIPVKYVEKDSYVTLPVALLGKVNLCAFDITIKYDPNILEFLDITNEDDDVIANHIVDEHCVSLNFVSTKNISGEIDLCDLKFKTLSNSNTVSDVKIEIKDIVQVQENGEFVKANYSVHNGVVNVLE